MEVIKTKKTSFIKLKPHSNEERGKNCDLLQVKCRNTVQQAKHESVEQFAKDIKTKPLLKCMLSRKPARASLGSDDCGVKAAPREGKAITGN